MLRGFFVLSHCFYRVITMVVFVGMLLFSLSVQAESTTQVGRYLTISHKALSQQVDLLSQTFQVRFPHTVCNIGDAVRYLLFCSGYQLANPSMLSKTVQAVLLQPLPQVQRKLGPMSLQDGLLTLVGQPFGLVVDPVHRLIGFRLKPDVQFIYGES